MTMSNILQVKYPGDYSRYLGQSDVHPLVSVVEYAELSPIRHTLNNYSVYGMFMHEHLSIGDGMIIKTALLYASLPVRWEARKIMANLWK